MSSWGKDMTGSMVDATCPGCYPIGSLLRALGSSYCDIYVYTYLHIKPPSAPLLPGTLLLVLDILYSLHKMGLEEKLGTRCSGSIAIV